MHRHYYLETISFRCLYLLKISGMHKTNDIVEYYNSMPIHKEGCLLLREIALSCGLVETLKWGGPVYTHRNQNLIGIGAFKSYFGIWFFNGALLKDELNVLVKGSEKTHTQKQWRFQTKNEIKQSKVKAYIKEAMKLMDLGVKMEIKPKPIPIDSYLEAELKNSDTLNAAWQALSLSCKREFADYINDAKKVETKLNRIEKIKPMILSKKGLHDKYR
jgi:uncharacterized protein YdeI (YjbR/CyaY-like superfamily)